MKKLFLKNIWQIVLAAAFLLAVWFVAYFAVGNTQLVPSVWDSFKAVGTLLVDSVFWSAFLHTLGRVCVAFVISFILAFGCALVAYMVPWFSKFFAPIVSMLRSLPVLAVLLILLVWLGASNAPIAVAFLSLFPMLYAGVLAALSGVDESLLEMSRVYKVPVKKRIVNLYVPFVAPYVTKEASAALSFSLKLVVSAEVLANTFFSVGGMMQEAKVYLDMPRLFALVLLTFCIGMLLEWLGMILAGIVERRVK